MAMVIKNSNETMKPIDITLEEMKQISKNYKKKKIMNHPQETENPLEYILSNPVDLEDELISIIKG